MAKLIEWGYVGHNLANPVERGKFDYTVSNWGELC